MSILYYGQYQIETIIVFIFNWFNKLNKLLNIYYHRTVLFYNIIQLLDLKYVKATVVKRNFGGERWWQKSPEDI